MPTQFVSLDDVVVKSRRVLVRMDLNVPMQGGRITDTTRITRLLPTLQYLIKKKARVIILSHFDRPGGKFVPSMSLAPLVDALSNELGGKEVRFGVDCIGPAARDAVRKLKDGDVLLLENLRFHPEEEKGDPSFARELASLGEIYVNDAFSCSHRAHASIVGIAKHLPAIVGRLMQDELSNLGDIFSSPKRPLTAIVGGSKISSKLDLLENLTSTMDKLIIGGAMANTFLHALGHPMGASLHEPAMKPTALRILKKAEKNKCEIVLPQDLVVTRELKAQSACEVVDADTIPAHGIAVDVGPASLLRIAQVLAESKTVVWNGPVGAFEISPFDSSTTQIARMIASLTKRRRLRSIAGGGDTVSAISHAGLSESFSYLSTAGGAFLEWLEGHPLPGVVALTTKKTSPQKAAAPNAPARRATRRT